MPSNLLKLSTPWERLRGLIYIETFESETEVSRNMGTATNSPTIDYGLTLPGSGSQHVVTRIPPSLLRGGIDTYLTFVVEFEPDAAYDALVEQRIFSTTSGNLFYLRKRSSDGGIVITYSSTIADVWTTAEIQSDWVQSGRNLIVYSAKSGDGHGWLNGTKLTTADTTTWTETSPTEIYHGISNDGSSNQFDGIIRSIRIFDSPDRFTTAEVNRYWNQDFRNPRDRAASYWLMNSSRHSTATTSDVTRNERDLTIGDGLGGATAPTKLSAKHGYSFDGGDYLTGSTAPAIGASESLTIECEFKLDDVAGFHGLVSRATSSTNVNFHLRVDDGKIEFYFRESTDTNSRQWEETGTSVQFGTRYHIVFQHTFGDSTSTRCFLNGQEVAGAWVSGGSDQPLENAGWTVQIGDRGVGDQQITGEIYSAAVWEEVLSRIEVLELYATARNQINLV